MIIATVPLPDALEIPGAILGRPVTSAVETVRRSPPLGATVWLRCGTATPHRDDDLADRWLFRRECRERDARVVGVVFDGADAYETARRTAARHGTTYPVFVAVGDGVDAAFEWSTGAAVRATPTWLLHDRAGTFVGAHAGPARATSARRHRVEPRRGGSRPPGRR